MPERIISSILHWLRAGYPEGVPTTDYFPLLALLRNSLTEEEFHEVIEKIEEYNPDPVRVSTIRRAIEQVTTDVPSEDEIRQVAARLAAAGWPLSSRAKHLADEAYTPVPDDATVGDVESGKYDGVLREEVAEEADLDRLAADAEQPAFGTHRRHEWRKGCPGRNSRWFPGRSGSTTRRWEESRPTY